MDLFKTTVIDTQIDRVSIIGQPKVIKGKGEGQGEVKAVVTEKL
jgi:hypothetical protein